MVEPRQGQPGGGDEVLPSMPGVPRDLEELQQSLIQIQIDERSSYGPELEAELAQEWQRILAAQRHRRRPGRRRRVAAVAAGLVVTGTLAVPPARASLVRLLWPLEAPVAAAEEPPVPEVDPPVLEPEVTRAFSKPSPASRPELTLPEVPDWPAPLPTTFPVLLDRDRAREIVADEYPDSLQQVGIGGTVQVLLWVRPDGAVDFTQIGKSSGISDLDMAALRATRTLRFLPATRAGSSVGTWVEFSIQFRPFDDQAEAALPDHAIQIPLSN